MLRTMCCPLMALAVGATGLWAADKPPEAAKNTREHHGAFVNVDLEKGTITFLSRMTLPLAKDATVLGPDDKPQTLRQLQEAEAKAKDKPAFIIVDEAAQQIAFLKGLPPADKEHRPRQATLVGVDVAKATVAFKARGKNGKEEEQTLPLAKDARVLSADYEPETLQQLKEAAKDTPLVVVVDENANQIIFVLDVSPPPPPEKRYDAEIVGLDVDKAAVAFEAEVTLPLAKDVKAFGEDGKPVTLRGLQEAGAKAPGKPLLIVEDTGAKQVVSVTELSPEKTGK